MRSLVAAVPADTLHLACLAVAPPPEKPAAPRSESLCA